MTDSSIRVSVNGSARSIASGSSIEQLVQELGLGTQRIAVELNGEILPRSQFSQQALADGDRVEIVQAIGGG